MKDGAWIAGVDGVFWSMAQRANRRIVASGQILFNATNHADKAVAARLLG